MQAKYPKKMKPPLLQKAQPTAILLFHLHKTPSSSADRPVQRCTFHNRNTRFISLLTFFFPLAIKCGVVPKQEDFSVWLKIKEGVFHLDLSSGCILVLLVPLLAASYRIFKSLNGLKSWFSLKNKQTPKNPLKHTLIHLRSKKHFPL